MKKGIVPNLRELYLAKRELRITTKALEIAIHDMYKDQIIDTCMIDESITRSQWEADKMQELQEMAASSVLAKKRKTVMCFGCSEPGWLHGDLCQGIRRI